MNRVFIALGSNIEDRTTYLKAGISAIQEHDIKLISYSSIYETDPVGYLEQESFLNMVIEVYTKKSPLQLLSSLQGVESQLGRNREIKWGPRTLDLDILLYNQENIETEDLIVPHPRMDERAFVIVPLIEIDQQLVIRDKSILNIYEELSDREGVRLWKRRNGEDVFELFES
ncbi:2-amino-4-hydroxy-6-hydroxymethyldihydropteridine diphosphokinase [Bacillus mesophilus]|uniref:2-amino-4-hydroxy-6-hydroxymethyldihydropteridine diphosphokinase n=1 Tax=Bacillus mesophilus TaxID=1808955 RepID=A0A6M0QCL0_9BACI|nr:2-amino-4-hydroxy-6-hydroxymethyldihydropteridine diphosphokinase [Bacillus mesophilus]MBM7663450.1 2-amino-4-hydroxy-6-hydroxymethyldihydropteridine diphosphokinase [Bacillus mesophilus]NEY74102.1 2-amino-4-hydroxy-6-hydroxymethyldihydropteridine diphosphokinase [Bacillus mesophilus]